MLRGFYVGEDSVVIFENGVTREYDRFDSDDLSEYDEEYDESSEDFEDSDWGYNEDEGFDPYEGCYTYDC